MKRFCAVLKIDAQFFSGGACVSVLPAFIVVGNAFLSDF